MATLKYDETGRLLFTEEMKQEYTILMPQMLPIHFTLMKKVFELEGYKMELLDVDRGQILREGIKYVHNDTCYPALLVIGQFMAALKSGKYDEDKTALIITQTGGGCRASNYIHLLRKALKRAGYEKIPVISLNLSGLEDNPGFKIGLMTWVRLAYVILYGDLLMLLANQCRPYELQSGQTDELVASWQNKLVEELKKARNLTYAHIKNNMRQIVRDFAAIPRAGEEKIRVGVVGEIYIKYSPVGNNDLEAFLQEEGAEVVVPGLLDFVIFKADNRAEDIKLYGGSALKRKVIELVIKLLCKIQRDYIACIEEYSDFRAPGTFAHLKSLVKGYVGWGNKMGEGWLLTGEMLELVDTGVENVVCTQPFGCLPNHVAGKGMLRKIRESKPAANIVAIDYDPGATKINQENRIKLMLENAKMTAAKRAAKTAAEKETVQTGAAAAASPAREQVRA